MFIGRVAELEKLGKLYDVGKFEMVVMLGRRRVGKTTLINEFIRDKESIFFAASETNGAQNLAELSNAINKDGSVFPDFKTAFEAIFKLAENRRIVFVIDEYPYLTSCSKGISSVLQHIIDRNLNNSNLFFIICGSSVSFMENQVLGYKSPLFGRRTAQFRIKPFDFVGSRGFFPNYNAHDAALAYGITGGIPLYMTKINDSFPLSENIKQEFLDVTGYFYEEPTNLIKQECREPAQYNSIISAIARGASRLSEIATKIGNEKTSIVSGYLNTLIEIGVVKKETPFGEKNSRRTVYTVSDSMFRFWYRFVLSHVSLITMEQSDKAYDLIEPQLSHFMGAVFEEICKQYLWRLLKEGSSAIDFIDLGRWWGTDPLTKTQAEIDIMGTGEKDAALFCECKWTNEKIDLPVLEALVARSELFGFTNKHFYLFAKTGFTKGCITRATEMGNVSLVRFEELVG